MSNKFGTFLEKKISFISRYLEKEKKSVLLRFFYNSKRISFFSFFSEKEINSFLVSPLLTLILFCFGLAVIKKLLYFYLKKIYIFTTFVLIKYGTLLKLRIFHVYSDFYFEIVTMRFLNVTRKVILTKRKTIHHNLLLVI